LEPSASADTRLFCVPNVFKDVVDKAVDVFVVRTSPDSACKQHMFMLMSCVGSKTWNKIALSKE
jgi:hypothetical protein